MSIYAAGDTHIPIDISKLNSKNFPEQKNMTKNDYIIVLGDFGLLWKNEIDATEKYWLLWLNNKNFTTLFLDGNHENHRRLYSGKLASEIIDMDGCYHDEYVIEKKFGGYVGRISPSIYHLRRGEVYTINNKKFFVMGGAHSIDKYNRIDRVSWWKEEEPNMKEFNYGLDNLNIHNNSVDYILAHTAPMSILLKYIDKYWSCKSTERFLEHIITLVSFKEFYCGHVHMDIDCGDKYHLLYNKLSIIK